jgi:hypothetical protein
MEEIKQLSVNVVHIRLDKKNKWSLMLNVMEEIKQRNISNLIVVWLDVGLSKVRQVKLREISKALVLVEQHLILKMNRNYMIGLLRKGKQGLAVNYAILQTKMLEVLI